VITLRAAVRHERADAATAVPQRPEKARPDLRVVEEGATKARADRPVEKRSASGVVATLLVLLLFVCVFGVVVFQVFLVQTQSHIDQLDRDIAKQEDRAKDLRLQTTDLEAPDRIVKDAEGRLGMIAPGDVVWLQPNPGDDTKAVFDPTKEAPPASAPPTTVAGTGTAGAGTSGAAGQGSGTKAAGTSGYGTGTGTNSATTPTTKWTPPTTAWTPPTTAWTPPTTAKATTATTAPAKPTTTVPKPTTTVARPTTTMRAR